MIAWENAEKTGGDDEEDSGELLLIALGNMFRASQSGPPAQVKMPPAEIVAVKGGVISVIGITAGIMALLSGVSHDVVLDKMGITDPDDRKLLTPPLIVPTVGLESARAILSSRPKEDE